jgi:hypothetical protein
VSRRRWSYRDQYDDDEWRKLHLESPPGDDDPAIDHNYKAFLKRLRRQKQKDKQMQTTKNLTIPQGGKCPCGQPLPWHMFRLAFGDGGINFSHNCSCDNLFEVVGDEVQLTGKEHNWIAEWDRNHEWDPNATDKLTGTKGAWVERS